MCDILVPVITFVGFKGPSYKQVGLSQCLLQDSLCSNHVVVRVRRDASENMEVATVPSIRRPSHLSSPTNISLEDTSDQSSDSNRHNASLHWPASQQSPNSTLLPAKATDNMTDILDILEASIFHHCCMAVSSTSLLYSSFKII